MKIIEALLAEHVVFHNLFDYLEAAAPKLKTLGEVRALAGLLQAMLEAHSAAEDALLIEPLHLSLDQLGHDENFHAEHEAIDADLAGIMTTRGAAQAKKLFAKVVAESRRHFDKEERLVFPLARRQLSERSQELLGRRWAAERKVFFE